MRKKNEMAFYIRVYEDKHTCAPSQKVKNLTSTWLSERFIQKLEVDMDRDICVFMVNLSHDTICMLSMQQL